MNSGENVDRRNDRRNEHLRRDHRSGNNGIGQDSSNAVRRRNSERGTKLVAINLAATVSREDVKELFFDFGPLHYITLYYSKYSNTGTAEVMFARRNDATRAMRELNNIYLDGVPIKIEIARESVFKRLGHNPRDDKERSEAHVGRYKQRRSNRRTRRGANRAGPAANPTTDAKSDLSSLSLSASSAS